MKFSNLFAAPLIGAVCGFLFLGALSPAPARADDECSDGGVGLVDCDGDGICKAGQDLNGDGNCNGDGEENADIEDEGRVGVDCIDADGDGECNGDCNDSDPKTHPGGTEACDGKDNDCDGISDEDFDTDGDGYADAKCGGGYGDGGYVDGVFVGGGGDCDDRNPAINPGADEICNGKDNDCDGQIDNDNLANYCEEVSDGAGCSTTPQSSTGHLGWLLLLLPSWGLLRRSRRLRGN